MRKLLYCISMLIAMISFGSCQREDFEHAVGSNIVSYTIEVPESLSTKTLGTDVLSVTELVYEVWKTEATSKDDYTKVETKLYRETVSRKNGVFEFDIKLINNQNFRILFWAQVPGNGVYQISEDKGLKEVKLSTSLNANSENYAAFAGSDFIKYGDNLSNRNITLVRPVSQLNIATAPESLEVGDTDITFKTTSVKVNGLSNVYNVAEGNVGTVGSEYTYSPTYPHLSEPSITVNGDEYTYVSMNYVGFADNNGDLVDVTYTIETNQVGTISNTIENVPVKPNHKTNIIGNLVADVCDYAVSISDGWGATEENITIVDNASSLRMAIENAPAGTPTEVKIEGDIDLSVLASLFSIKAETASYALQIPENKSIVLDLNGHTVSQTVECSASYSMIENKGSLTIIDCSENGTGKITFKDSSAGDPTFAWGSYAISNQGTLVINGGTIEHTGVQNTSDNVRHMYCAVQQNNANASLTVNGGTISNATYRSMRINSGTTVINRGIFVGQVWVQPFAEGIVLEIKGGKFSPSGADGSSVFVTNNEKNVNFAVTGGFFNTKISCSTPSDLAGTVTGGTFSSDAKDTTPKELYDGYKFVQDGENWILEQLPDIVKIGDTGYHSIQAAINAVQEGQTITLHADIEQVDGVIITDKNLTVDLNDKTFTVSEGASTNNRNFKIDGSSVVTIKNGTMVAAGEYSSGVYGTVRTEGTANVTLEDVKLYNYRGNGLNVKALSGTTVTITNSEIYSQYGGAVEAAGGTIELNDVNVEQKGMYTAPYNSMAISVNGGGTVTVNSGTYSTECLTAEEADNQGTSHGPWCAGVCNSGGTLTINGGTFSNDNFGDNSLATAARGLLLADTGANIQINGGTFNALKAIVDVTNNLGDASKNPSVTLVGGDFSADPRVSGLYASELISVAEGFVVKEENGRFTIGRPVAKVGNTEYGSIDEAITAWRGQNNSTLTLLDDVTLSDVVTLKSTEHHILELSTFTMTAAEGKDAIVIQACGNGNAERSAITIKANQDNPGGINAVNKSIIYYKYADGGITTEDRPIIRIEGGVFTGSTASYGTAGIYTIGSEARKCATLTIIGGTFNCSINGSGKSKLLISGGVFNYSVGSQGDSTALRLISGGKFKSFGFMTADDKNTKFWIGTAMAKSDVGVYVDDEGYLVVGGSPITEFGTTTFQAKVSCDKWSQYLNYSSAKDNGLYCTSAEYAIKKWGSKNVTVREDLKGSLVDLIEEYTEGEE